MKTKQWKTKEGDKGYEIKQKTVIFTEIIQDI